MSTAPRSGTSAIRARIEWVRGMCSDEASHVDIDQALGEILDLIDPPMDPEHAALWAEHERLVELERQLDRRAAAARNADERSG